MKRRFAEVPPAPANDKIRWLFEQMHSLKMSVGMRLICLSCGGVARLEAPDSVSILSGGVTDGKIRSGVGTHVKMKGKLRACSFFFVESCFMSPRQKRMNLMYERARSGCFQLFKCVAFTFLYLGAL